MKLVLSDALVLTRLCGNLLLQERFDLGSIAVLIGALTH